MKKRETKKLTPERLQQFGFAYAPPLIINREQIDQAISILDESLTDVEAAL